MFPFGAMNVRMLRLCLTNSLTLLLLLFVSLPSGAQNRRPDTGPKPKNVRGIVEDLQGKPLADARVFVRNTKTNIVRTLTTERDGAYSVYGLPPTGDYEVYAEFKGKPSEKKFVSSFLNREDNVLNFRIDAAVISDTNAGTDTSGLTFQSSDLVDLHASFEMPLGVPAPVPSVLLLHGYGEDRSVWQGFTRELVNRGWAVMALDLRGHGQSTMKNQAPIVASPEWRTNPREFPIDLDPALDWLKARPRINTQKIVVIGSDVGANLALLASSRFPEVRTVVAIKPNLTESLAMAGSAQDFHPRSALIVVTDQAAGDRLRQMVKPPSRVQIARLVGGTSEQIANKQVADAVFQWLKETF